MDLSPLFTLTPAPPELTRLYAPIQHSPSNVAGITRAVGSYAHHIHERCSDLRFNNDAGYVFDDRSCKITETSLLPSNGSR